QSYHRKRNRAVANEVDHPLKDVFRVVIKAHDEPAHHFHAVALNSIYRIKQAAPHVLLLLRLLEAVFVRSFYAEKDSAESRLTHAFEQLRVFGEVDARLGQKGKRPSVSLLPLGQLGQQRADVLLVADEVVVDDEHRSSPTRRSQGVELGQNLFV